MTIPSFFRARTAARMISLAGIAMTMAVSGQVRGGPPTNDYPTVARVEYVNECIGANGGKLAALYQCSCAIDKIAAQLTYDEFVEAGTYARYAALPGEGGGIFRDPPQGKELAKLYRKLESEAHSSCGLAR